MKELQPGEAEPFSDGRRHRKLKDGKVVVDAKVWSPLRANNIMKTFDSVAEARNWQAAYRTGRVHGREVDVRQAKRSFAAIAADWLMSMPNKGVRACETNRDHLKRAGAVLCIEGEGSRRKVTVVGKPTGFAARPIGGIRTSQVETLIDTWKAEGYSDNTIAGMYSSVRAVFSYAEKSGAIPKRSSPCWDVTEVPKWKRVERPLHLPDDADPDEYIGVKSVSNDELIALAEALGPDYELAVWLGVCFGLRYQEAFGLTVGSVENLMQGMVNITQVLDRQGVLRRNSTKTAAGKRFIIDQDLNADIMEHMARRGLTLNDHPDTLLFVNAATGGPLTYSAWHKLWRKALVKAGLTWKKENGQSLGLHDLRSMNRTIMNEVGVDPTTARGRFGHAGTAEERLDDRYARSAPRQNRLASEKIHTVVRRVRSG